MSSKITHAVLYANDFKKLFQFYKELMAFPVSAGEQEDFAEFTTEQVTLAILGPSVVNQLLGSEASKAVGRAKSHLSLSVDNVDEMYNALQSKGAKFLKEPTTQPWGQRTAFLSDPEGNLWEIYSWVQQA